MGEDRIEATLEPTEAKEVQEDGLPKRKRKKQLYDSIRSLMEFWFSDVNLSKDRFLSQMVSTDPWVDLEIFLRFNKLRTLTQNISDVVKALRKSEFLEVSEDGKKVCRVSPVEQKNDSDACTIYVEQIPPDAEHDWLKSVFSVYGPIDYVSLPRFKATQKPKGFAFIEFKTSEIANKAIEAFKAKDCCLSPQMDPDKLVSIATFEKDEYNYNSSNIQSDDTELKSVEDEVKKKSKGETSNSNENKEEIENHQTIKPLNDCPENIELVQDVVKEKKKKKRTSGNNEREESEINKGVKRQRISESDHSDSVKMKKKKEKNTSTTQMEEDTENNTGEEAKDESVKEEEDKASGIENCESDGKKKHKRKKKHKKNINPVHFGLQIMPKPEWKRLRNKYLDMQKLKMKQLKNHLRNNKWQQRTPKWHSYHYNESGVDNQKVDVDKTDLGEKKKLVFTPGVIIKAVLDKPVTDVKMIKNQARVHPEVRYVDASEGEQEIYLRVGSAEMTDQVINTNAFPSMQVVKGKEEKQYWEKILRDREEKFTNKIRVNQRGRDKLLKKAEKYQGQHIGFDNVTS